MFSFNLQNLSFFFFNDTATTEIYTLSLHDALPISGTRSFGAGLELIAHGHEREGREVLAADRKSTRLNSSHVRISYAVFCLKKKKNTLLFALTDKMDALKLIHEKVSVNS